MTFVPISVNHSVGLKPNRVVLAVKQKMSKDEIKKKHDKGNGTGKIRFILKAY